MGQVYAENSYHGCLITLKAVNVKQNSTNYILRAEFDIALKMSRNNKSSNFDNIPAQIIKINEKERMIGCLNLFKTCIMKVHGQRRNTALR